MMNKLSIEAVNRTLQDLRSNLPLFGEVTFFSQRIFGQFLPVIIKGTRADEVDTSFERSVLWIH